MPFVAKEEVQELETLRAENERMAEQLAEFEEMRPHLQLAEEIRTEIIAALENNEDGLDARSIAERAYSNVLRRKVEEARDEVAARYEQEHRRNLYERLLGEIATNEGDEISHQVREKVETDPELAVQLRDSARKELAARAKDVVRGEVTAAQQEVINSEAKRQVELDHLDVKLAVDGELDLCTDEVVGRVMPGDKVVLFFEKEDSNKSRGRLELIWVKDANGKEGWVFNSCSEEIVDMYVRPREIEKNKFLQVGVVNQDLDNGQEIVQSNKLIIGKQLVVTQKVSKEKSNNYKLFYKAFNMYYGNSTKAVPIQLLGSDFQTKDIQFFSASANKSK